MRCIRLEYKEQVWFTVLESTQSGLNWQTWAYLVSVKQARKEGTVNKEKKEEEKEKKEEKKNNNK